MHGLTRFRVRAHARYRCRISRRSGSASFYVSPGVPVTVSAGHRAAPGDTCQAVLPPVSPDWSRDPSVVSREVARHGEATDGH